MSRIWGLVLFLVPILGTLLIVWAILGAWPLAGHWLPENVNEYGGVIDHLFNVILWITGVIFIGTGVVLAMTMWPAKGGSRTADYVHGNHTMEIIWAVVPAGILIFLSIYQINAWAENKMDRPMEVVDGIERPIPPMVRVVVRQFDWDFFYPGPDGVFDTVDDFMVTGEVHVPMDEPVVFQIESSDVLHSFFVPSLRVKQDIVPGMSQFVWFQANKAGRYEVACTELCGWGHYKMGAILEVQSPDDYALWLEEITAERLATTIEFDE